MMIASLLAVFHILKQLFHGHDMSWEMCVTIAGSSLESYIAVGEAMKPFNLGRKYIYYLLTKEICRRKPELENELWVQFNRITDEGPPHIYIDSRTVWTLGSNIPLPVW